MDKKLALVDNHMHTQLAYCAENITVETAVTLAEEFGLAGITFTEHSGQLYFSRDEYWEGPEYWGGLYCREGIPAAREAQNRMPQYIELARCFVGATAVFGLELDCDDHGNLIIKNGDRKEFNFILGAIHQLPGLREGERTEVLEERYLAMLERILSGGIDVLAHPFRAFERPDILPPERLYPAVIDLLRKHDTAAEVNGRGAAPSPEFYRLCLERGVKLSFGGDVKVRLGANGYSNIYIAWPDKAIVVIIATETRKQLNCSRDSINKHGIKCQFLAMLFPERFTLSYG